MKSINIKTVIHDKSVIKFEIIEFIDKLKVRDRENELIAKYWDNPFLLNRCPNAYNVKGIRPYIGYVKRVREKSNYVQFCRKIAEYTVSGELIKVHKSITSFCKEKNTPSDNVHKILLGKRGQPKAYHIKEVLPNGEILIPPHFKRTLSEACKPKEKRVNVIDSSGNIIKTCFNIVDTAKYLNCSGNLVRWVLNEKPRYKRAKGYFLKYA